MAAGTISTMTIALLMVGNGFLLAVGLVHLTSGFSLSNIPPPPRGFNLADVLNAPMVGQTIQAASSGGLNPLLIVRSLIVNFATNIAVYAASFIISGALFSRIFHLFRRTPKASLAAAPTVPSPQPPGQPPASIMIIVLALLLLLASTLILPRGFGAGSGSSGIQAGEQLALNLQKDGTLKMIYSTNVSSLPGVPAPYQGNEFRSLLGGFLFAFNGSIDLGQGGTGGSAGSGGSLSFLLPLLPSNGFLAVYGVSDSSTGRARADVLASDFGQGFGVNLRSTVSMELPSFGGQSTPSGGIYFGIYTGDSQPGPIGNRILALVQGSGVGSTLTSQKVFVSQFGVQAGFINLNFQNSTATPSLIPSVQVTADLTTLGNFYGRGNFTLGVREILGSQGTISPSSVAKTTSVHLGFPANSTVTGHAPSNAALNAAQGNLDYSMNATSQPVPNVYVNFTSTFPQKITINRQLNPQQIFPSGTTVTETVTIRNLGNETIHGTVASEKELFLRYPTLQLLSTSQNITLGDIPSQGAANATLQFKVNSDGFYTLPPTIVTYMDQGQAISKNGPESYVQSSFNLQLYLQTLIAGTAPYSYLCLFLLVLPPLLQLRKISRGAKTRKGAYMPVPPTGQPR